MINNKFRIESKTGLANDTKIFYIDEKEGIKQEISAALHSIKIELNVGDLNHAELLLKGIIDYEIDIHGGEMIFKLPKKSEAKQ
jgi:hypothetical protein